MASSAEDHSTISAPTPKRGRRTLKNPPPTRVIVKVTPCCGCNKNPVPVPPLRFEDKILKKSTVFNSVAAAIGTVITVAGWVYMKTKQPQPVIEEPTIRTLRFTADVWKKKPVEEGRLKAEFKPSAEYLKFLEQLEVEEEKRVKRELKSSAELSKLLEEIQMETTRLGGFGEESKRNYFRMLQRWIKRGRH